MQRNNRSTAPAACLADGGSPSRPGSRWTTAAIVVALAIATLAVYWQVRNFDFLLFDDDIYVSDNPHVRNGLTPDGIFWAFRSGYAANWHPLTWLSLMLDCHLFGPRPGPMHMINVMLHLANALLLFAVLRMMTGALWQSAFVAAAFAFHPAHVESVAWITERKDVLSTFFMMLTLLAYAGYARQGGRMRYLLALLLFALGLMAKPMIVTLPILLLLLDCWPLGRFASPSALRRLVIEKIPFFFLSAVSGIVTLLVQRAGGAVISTNILPLHDRLANAILSYVTYIEKLFWPRNLALFYPLDVQGLGPRLIIPCILLLLGISLLVFLQWHSRRYLAVGWLWFAGTLVPVIGVMQVGLQAMADRYTYIPYTGLFIMIAWSMADAVSAAPRLRLLVVAVSLSLLTACALQTWHITSFWKDSVTIFARTIAVTGPNGLMHKKLGDAFLKSGQFDKAADELKIALSLAPDASVWHTMGQVLEAKGRLDEALRHYLKANSMAPDQPKVNLVLGLLLNKMRRYQEAERFFRRTIALSPESAYAYIGLAQTLRETNRPDESIAAGRKAVELAPKQIEAHQALALALTAKGDYQGATDEYRRCLDIDHDLWQAWNDLGDAQENLGDFAGAEASYRQAVVIQPNNAVAHYNLGSVLGKLGQKDAAAAEFRKALAIDPNYADARRLLGN